MKIGSLVIIKRGVRAASTPASGLHGIITKIADRRLLSDSGWATVRLNDGSVWTGRIESLKVINEGR